MSYRNAGRHRRTKGVVLFTVVAIMLFLLIMVTSTLSIVSSAQRRTYTEFKENQAYFTARSGIASFLRGASEKDETSPLIDLHDEFLDLCKDGNIYDDSGKSFSDMDSDADVMKMTVEFPQPPQSGGDLKYLYGECKVYAYKTGADKAKIVSRATLGGNESVVTLYISVPPQKPELFKNAMTSFANVTNSTVGILGGMGAYVNPANGSKAVSSRAENTTMTYTNNGFVSRNVVIGSGATLATQAEFVFQEVVGKLESDGTYVASAPDYRGITVMGDAKFTNTPTIYGKSSTKRPYIYADGQLYLSTGPDIGANFDDGTISDSAENKVNVYCNTFISTNAPTLNGDLYMYGLPEDTAYAYMTTDGADKTSNSIAGGVYYGNIYCNGDLVIGAGGQVPEIHGDVYCTGTLTINNGTINGDVYADTLNDNVGLDPDKVNAYEEPSDFISKDFVRQNIIANPGDQFDNFRGVDKDNNPINGTIYPALGYYTDASGNWLPRTEVDSSWSIWNPYDYFQMNDSGRVAYIDATDNNLNIVVPNGFFPSNTQNNKIVIKGDKRVDFYIVEHTPNPWVWGDDPMKTSSSNQNSARHNMVITEDFYNKLSSGSQIHIACPGETDNISLNIYYNIQDGMTYNIEGDLLMGYIYGPNAVVNMNNGVSIDNINYDGASYGTIGNLQFIGSCVTSNISTSNNVQGIFLPPVKANTEGDGKFWTDLYYLNY